MFCQRGYGRDDQESEERLEIPKEQKEKMDKEKEKVNVLFQCIKEKDIEKIKQLIEEGVNVKEAVEDKPAKQTVLHCLAEMQDEPEHQLKEMFELFLKNECHINSKDEFGNTPLKLAAEKGNTIILQLLLDNKADHTIKDKHQEDTPLHWAAKNGKREAVKILCEGGAIINDQNKSHQTPLHLAVEKEKKDIVIDLCIYGAVKTIKDKDECTPLDVAKRKHFKEIEDLLVKPIDELLRAISSSHQLTRAGNVCEYVVSDSAGSGRIYHVNVYGGQAAIGPNATIVSNQGSPAATAAQDDPMDDTR